MEEFVKIWCVFVFVALGGYLIGNINPAILLGRLYGVDIKREGSGNAGTTNALRTLGKKIGALVFFVDVIKGLGPVLLVLDLFGRPLAMTASVAIVLGHMFPVFFKFRGGKGVATSLGVLLAMNWQLGLALLGIFVVVVLLFRMVSLGAVVACAGAIPVAGVFYNDYFIWMTILAALICLKHTDNIIRIVKKEERRLF
jgi:glycerol-3-phosphate acyltransferase PlsY